jgi:hypothetical protein
MYPTYQKINGFEPPSLLGVSSAIRFKIPADLALLQKRPRLGENFIS